MNAGAAGAGASTACQPERAPDATPTRNDIRPHYANLGISGPVTEWNPETGTYEPEAS